MRFFSPLSLLGLTLIALPVAIHLLVRRYAVRLDFPSLKFLRETPSFRLRPRRIQQPLLLAMRIAAIALLAFGLARPLISFSSKLSQSRVLLLDASLSMQANTRTTAAKEQARAVIDSMKEGERAAIISFTTEANVLAQLTSNKPELISAIDRFKPTNGRADYSVGLIAANEVLNAEQVEESSIDLISDFQTSGIASLRQAQTNALRENRVVPHPVGERLQRNAYLSDIEVIANDSKIEIAKTQILDDGSERNATRNRLSIDSANGSTLDGEWRTETNGQVIVHLRSIASDDYDADDVRFISFSTPKPGRILLIESDEDPVGPYLRTALESISANAAGKRFAFERKTLMPSKEEIRPFSLVVMTLHGKPQADGMLVLHDYIRAGGWVWLLMGDDIDTTAWNDFSKSNEADVLPFVRLERIQDNSEPLQFGGADQTAPAFRSMNDQSLTTLRTVRMRNGFQITPRANSNTIMRWNNGQPAFVFTGIDGRGGILLLAASPARNDGALGFSTAFPSLVYSIARLSVEQVEPLSYEIGQPVRLKLDSGAVVKIENASGEVSNALARDLLTNPSSYFSIPGIYKIESTGYLRFLAINAPESESDVVLASTEEIARVFDQQRPAIKTRQDRPPLDAKLEGQMWRYLLLGTFLLLIAELFVSLHSERNKVRAEP